MRILVPYFRKKYARIWEQKSLPVWYREHWQNREMPTPVPIAFQRVETPSKRNDSVRKHLQNKTM